MTHYTKNEAGILVPFAPHICKRRWIEGEVQNRTTMKGLYKMTVRRADGSVKQETPWFENLILDAGLNRLGTGGGVARIEIGTGTAAPAVGQTTLQSFSARTANFVASGNTASVTSPYFVTGYATARFAIGALNGNYTEVGAGWADNQLFSRALITPDGVNPEPITVLSDEQLDVSYSVRVYPYSETDFGAGVVTISGSNYDIVGRVSRVTDTPIDNLFYWPMVPVSQHPFYGYAYNGPIGTITGQPSGALSEASGTSFAAYSNNSLTNTGTISFGLTAGNLAGGIRSMHIYPRRSGIGYYYQYQFTPAIPKDGTKTLALSFSCSWGRH